MGVQILHHVQMSELMCNFLSRVFGPAGAESVRVLNSLREKASPQCFGPQGAEVLSWLQQREQFITGLHCANNNVLHSHSAYDRKGELNSTLSIRPVF